LIGGWVDNNGHAMKIAHFLELARGSVGKFPAMFAGIITNELGFAQAVGAPDANRGAAPLVGF